MAVTAIVFVLVVSLCTNLINAMMFIKNRGMDNATCPPERQLFDIIAPSEISCLVHCEMNHDTCLGISFQPAGSRCYGCRAHACNGPPADEVTSQGAVTYGKENTSLLSGMTPVPDSYWTTNSVYNNDSLYAATSGRLCSVKSATNGGSWVGELDANAYIQVRLRSRSIITNVVTAGRNDPSGDPWVAVEFYFFYSENCSTYTTFDDGFGGTKIFQIPTPSFDPYIHRNHSLPQPVVAECVKIQPVTNIHQNALRFDLIGRLL